MACGGTPQQGRLHLQARGSSRASQVHQGLLPVVQLSCCSPARADTWYNENLSVTFSLYSDSDCNLKPTIPLLAYSLHLKDQREGLS